MQDNAFAEAPIEAPKVLDRDWLAVVASAVGLMLGVGTLTIYTFGVFVGPLSAEFHWSRTELFGAVAISQYALALSVPFWGFLTDRFGPRLILLPSVVVISLLFASLALLTPKLWHLYLIFALFPLLAGGASPLGYSAVIIRKFERKLGQALGLALMGVGLGAAVLPPFTQELIGAFGWRNAYATMGLLTLLITLPAALVATRGVQPRIADRAVESAPSVMTTVRTRTFLLMCVLFVLIGIISVGALAHLVPMMTDRGFAPGAAARVASLAGFAAIIGRGGLGWLLDRIHASYLLAAVSLMAVCAFLLISFGTGPVPGYVAAVLVGMVVGAEVDFVSFLVRRYFADAAYGRLYGIAFGIFIVGVGTGPLILGASFDRLGGYRPGLLLFAAMGVFVAAAAFALPAYVYPSSSTQADPQRAPDPWPAP
jgi:MFS family permease